MKGHVRIGVLNLHVIHVEILMDTTIPIVIKRRYVRIVYMKVTPKNIVGMTWNVISVKCEIQ